MKGSEGSIVACFGANKDAMPFFDVQKKKAGQCLQLRLVGKIFINFVTQRESIKWKFMQDKPFELKVT